jgi:Coenzyme PQQ synthesis protein D (PqqD)
MAGAGIPVVISEIAWANPVLSLLFRASTSRMGAGESTIAGRVRRIDPPPPNRLLAETPQPNIAGVAEMDLPLSFHTIVVAAPEQVSCPLGEEAAILNLKNSVYYGMNPVGARVWELLKQPKSVGELRDILLEEFEVDQERCGTDLLALLGTLQGEGLIEVRGATAGS